MKSSFFKSIRRFFQPASPFWASKSAFQIVFKRVKTFTSKQIDRKVRLEIYLPPSYSSHKNQKYPLLLFNDGQDLPPMQFAKVLDNLYKKELIKPAIIVGIYAGDRMQEYGTAQVADYKNRGSKAQKYTQFILTELIPFLHKKYQLNHEKAIAGFSLGGLSAFDIAWNHAGVFRKVGVFSGSFWWRSKPFDPQDPDANRITHTMVEKAEKKEGLKFWFQTGTLDEKEDRNNNGIIDSIDDTRDLIKALSKHGFQDGLDIQYTEVQGGHHNVETWGQIMPEFLKWAL